MPVDLGVVIVAYNSETEISGLLESLGPALGQLSAHVVVVDNGSSDKTVRVARQHPVGPQVIEQANRGYAAGINAGVESCPECPAWLVLNPDVRLGRDSVTILVDALKHRRVGIVVPQVCDGDGNRVNSLRRVPTLGRASGLSFTRLSAFDEYVTDDHAYASAHAVDWALGAVMLVSRECHVALSGWDESFFLYSEETDLCLRASDAGFLTWYEPRAKAMHVGGASGRNDHTHTMQILNRVRLYVRRESPARGWAYWTLTVLSETSWVLRGHRQSRASLRALLRPSQRPRELGLSQSLLPS